MEHESVQSSLQRHQYLVFSDIRMQHSCQKLCILIISEVFFSVTIRPYQSHKQNKKKGSKLARKIENVTVKWFCSVKPHIKLIGLDEKTSHYTHIQVIINRKEVGLKWRRQNNKWQKKSSKNKSTEYFWFIQLYDCQRDGVLLPQPFTTHTAPLCVLQVPLQPLGVFPKKTSPPIALYLVFHPCSGIMWIKCSQTQTGLTIQQLNPMNQLQKKKKSLVFNMFINLKYFSVQESTVHLLSKLHCSCYLTWESSLINIIVLLHWPLLSQQPLLHV